MNKLAIVLVIALIGGTVGWYSGAWREGEVVAAPHRPAQVMWLCLETGRLSEGPRPVSGEEGLRLNTETGRASLVQALYCPRCQGWRRMPPIAVRERMPGGPVCPKTRTPLSEVAPPGAPREVVH